MGTTRVFQLLFRVGDGMNDIKKNAFVCSKSQIGVKEGLLRIDYGETETLLPVGCIRCLFLENQSITVSVQALSLLASASVPVIACNEKHQPFAQVIPMQDSFHNSGSLFQQMKWPNERKTSLVEHLLENKILMQRKVLEEFSKEIPEIFHSDLNPVLKEGPVAKAYFHCLFGPSFSREDESETNAKLNYGYAVLAAMITKEIVSHGFQTQLGIHHHSETNAFNLTYDFIEPFRPFVDSYVYKNISGTFDFAFKTKFATDLSNTKTMYGAREFRLCDAIAELVQDSLSYLSEKNGAGTMPEVSF